MNKKKLVLTFPGQGSQYVGMGTKFVGTPLEKNFFAADKDLGYSISKLMLEGPEEELNLTKNTQPAILTYSYLCFLQLQELLKSNSAEIHLVLGHSVGEYCALVAAGSISFSDALKAVHLRGTYMQEAVPAGIGSMMAILKAEENLVQEACAQAFTSDECQVSAANFNDPSQIVISGHKEAIQKALAYMSANAKTPFRSIELKVSAPFHSPLMRPAAEKMKKLLQSISINYNKLGYLANIDANLYGPGTGTSQIVHNLV